MFAGYYVLDVEDLDPALAFAQRIPALRWGGAVEVRPGPERPELTEQAFRDHWARVLAHLVGYLRDFDLAEDATQEAFAIAAERWPREGEPANQLGWLVATARNRAIDRLRRERTLAEKTRELQVEATSRPGSAPEDEMDESTIPDERLEMIFACCHPALATDAQVALTLRAMGGMSTEQIAHAFLVAPETMKRRLSRARARITSTGIPFSVPAEPLLSERLRAVLAVIYLIFNEGYSARGELADEAIRLGRLLALLLPDEPEVHGLLALMLLHHARREARFAGGELVLLNEQDRDRWDDQAIACGRTALGRARSLGGGEEAGTYAIQAAIASEQLEPPHSTGPESTASMPGSRR